MTTRELIAPFTVAALLVTLGGATAEGRGGLAAEGCAVPRPSARYSARVDRALGAGRDAWGNALLRSAAGPTYRRVRRYLPPLLYARGPRGTRLTRSGVYYLPFSQPLGPDGSSTAALHVADGGEILAGRATGPSLTVLVGARGRERYGSCLARLGRARLAGGYLPILETSYEDAAGVRYRQESFAARDPQSSTLASYVRLDADARRARHEAELRFETSRGRAARFDLPSRALLTAYVSWPIGPGEGEPTVVDRATYEAARRSIVGFWERRLGEGEQIEVPERRVSDAARALLIQNLALAWRYSIGNPYQELSYPEAIDVGEVLASYGYASGARSILLRSLAQTPTRYPNWQMGQKLVGSALYYRLFEDRSFLEWATPVLRGYVETLGRQIEGSRPGILRRERYSSDVADRVYGLHSQAVVWQGLSAMADAWRASRHQALARRADLLAARLGGGLREVVRRSERRLDDGSLFLDVRLLDPVAAYRTVTESRFGSYWNLVMPYALGSGLFPPGGREAKGILRYLSLHGSRLLGLVRAGAYALYGRSARYPASGTDQVYGLNVSRFLADNHHPEQLLLSLYGQLAAAMTPDTFVSGEAASVAPLPGGRDRSMYLPPNGASNASFLGALQLALVHEVRDERGTPRGLELAYSTPRAWLEPGKRIVVRGVPTSFGPVSFAIRAGQQAVRISLDLPARPRPASLRLRLRLPRGNRVTRVDVDGNSFHDFESKTATLDLSGLSGHVELVVVVARHEPSSS